jgi:hypothetical protein
LQNFFLLLHFIIIFSTSTTYFTRLKIEYDKKKKLVNILETGNRTEPHLWIIPNWTFGYLWSVLSNTLAVSQMITKWLRILISSIFRPFPIMSYLIHFTLRTFLLLFLRHGTWDILTFSLLHCFCCCCLSFRIYSPVKWWWNEVKVERISLRWYMEGWVNIAKVIF